MAHSRSSLSQWLTRAVGMSGALLIHALLFQAATLGASASKSRTPEEQGPGASPLASGLNASMTLVLVQLPGVMSSDPLRLEALASNGVTLATGAIQIISPDPTPVFDVQDDSSDVSAEAAQPAGDPAVHSLLFGRYTGQINARIERAWRKPRSAITDTSELPPSSLNGEAGTVRQDDLFRCTAKITQDARGNVEEIELVRCNGSYVWQQSLVDAVQQASPLPAPPSPSVFTNVLTLTFEGRTYAAGMAEENNEPPMNRPVRVRDNADRFQPEPSASFVDSLNGSAAPGLPFDAPAAPEPDGSFASSSMLQGQ